MSSTPPQSDLSAALRCGGIDRHVQGSDRYEVFRSIVDGLPSYFDFDRGLLLDQLLAREKSGGTPIGEGIAIPHSRYPLIVPDLPPLVRVCYLTQPLNYGAADGLAVWVLLLLVCPSPVEHRRLSQEVTTALQTPIFRTALKATPDLMQLLAVLETNQASESLTIEGYRI